MLRKIAEKLKSSANAALVKARTLAADVKYAAVDNAGADYVDVAVKIIIAVVIGALLITGLTLLWNSNIFPQVRDSITSLFG
jgi:hypothetical protein